jgi:putative endonuclease
MRVSEHNAGTYCGYTKARRPVELVYWQDFDQVTDAINAERQLKGWSRAKKEALMRGDLENLVRLSRNRTQYPSTSSGRGIFDKLRMRDLRQAWDEGLYR